MSIFYNIESKSCMTMGTYGNNVDGAPVVLEDCTNVVGNSENLLDSTGSYQIQYNNTCLQPSTSKTDSGNTYLKFGSCDNNSSYFEIADMNTNTSKTISTDTVTTTDVYILYNDNTSSYLNGTSNNEGLMLTKSLYSDYSVDDSGDPTTLKTAYNMMINTSESSINAAFGNIVRDLAKMELNLTGSNESNNEIWSAGNNLGNCTTTSCTNNSTMYDNWATLVQALVNAGYGTSGYTGTSPYSNTYFTLYNMTKEDGSSLTVQDLMATDINVICNMKYVVNSYDAYNNLTNISYYYISPDIQKTGMYFSPDETTDKIMLKLTVNQFYTNDDRGLNGLPSENTSVFTMGLWDGDTFSPMKIDTRKYIYGFSLNNGSTSFRLILKDNSDRYKWLYQYSSALTTSNSVSLSSYINPKKKMLYINENQVITSDSSDDNTGTNYNFQITPVSESFVEGATDSSDDLSIQISTMLQNLENNPTNFTDAINAINTVISNASGVNSGNAWYHSQGTISNLLMFRDTLNALLTCYNSLKTMNGNMTTIINGLSLNILLNQTVTAKSISFDYDTFKSTIIETQTVLQQVQTFQDYINSNQQVNAPTFTFTGISVDLTFLMYLTDLFNYFTEKTSSLYTQLNIFYDYLGAKQNGSFPYCKQSYINAVFPTAYQNFDTSLLTITQSSISSSTSTMDLNAFIQEGNNFTNSTKQFFDIDFQSIYDYFYGSNSNISSSISDLLLSSVSIYNGELMNYYYGWLISQQSYANYFNEYSTCITKIEAILNYTNAQSSNAYQNILTSYYDNVCTPFINQFNSYFPSANSTSNMSFLRILTYYVNKIRSETNSENQAKYFAFCYANISNISITDVNVLFNNISSLETYYTNQEYFMTYYNNTLIESYMSKFKSSATLALTDGNLVTNSDMILDYNNETLKTTLANMSGTTYEGFTSSSYTLNPDATTIFPSTPACLDTRTIYQSTANSTKLIEDGYTYLQTDGTYATFTQYMNNLVSDSSVDFTRSDVFSCSDGSETIYPSISMDFYCGETSQPTYGGVYNKDIFSTTCNDSTCDINLIMTIELVDDTTSGTSTLYININDVNKVTLATGLPLTTTLNIFENSGESYSFTTSSSNGIGTIDMLTKISSTDIVGNLTGNKCLMDNNNFVRLYISSSGILTYEYIPRIKEEIASSIFVPKPIYAVKPPDGSGKYTTLYDINTDQYKVGSNLENVLGYVGYDGVYHNISESSNSGYELYPGYCFNANATDQPTDETGCSNDTECIGTLDWPATGSTSKYKITRDNIDRVYPCETDGVTTSSSFNIKKFGINTSNNACINNASNTQIIDYATYELLEKGDNFDDSKCGFNVLLDKNRTKLEETRDTFKQTFENMLITFNALNESELQMLEATKVNVNELSTMITDYNEIVDKTAGKMDRVTTSSIQKQNSHQLHKKMEYKTAIVGIGAIAMALGCLHYMKK